MAIPKASEIAVSRRDLLRMIGGGFGLYGYASLLENSGMLAAVPTAPTDPLAVKPAHFPARAKRVIFLFMNGGLSQVDTFDPKPQLTRRHGQPMPGGYVKTERKTGNLMRSPFRFKRYGQSGIEVSELFSETARHIDDISVIRSMHTEVPNHPPGMFLMNCGHQQPGRPSLGSWITYGLGTENRNLPGFMVLCPSGGPPTGGVPLWNSAFLPAVYQGTRIPNDQTTPDKLIHDIRNSHLTRQQQRRQLDLLDRLNSFHRGQRPADPQLEGSIHSMEIAYRMQVEAPEVFDLSKENPATLERYGQSDFARGCLMALRLVERGVRVVQVYFGTGQPWDSHYDIMAHQRLAREADPAMANLLQDLKDRGLFEDTLVICGSEFGRTPVVETSGASVVQNGRDHNHWGFSVWLAGAGVRGGTTYGSTDDFGFKAVENKVHVHDLHATVLHLLGLDHEKLTYRYSGRDFRLTDVHGRVVRDVLA